jgi:hypothetical protein
MSLNNYEDGEEIEKEESIDNYQNLFTQFIQSLNIKKRFLIEEVLEAPKIKGY